MSGEARDNPIDSSQKTASKGDGGNTAMGRPARLKSASRGRAGTGSSGSAKAVAAAPAIDVVLERRGRGYAVMIGDRMKQAGDDGDSFYRAVLLALGQTRGDEVASYDIQALRNDVADTLMPRLNSGLLRNWWQNRKRRTGLTPERYIERYIRSPGSWDEPLAQLLPVIVPSSATWRRLGGKRLTVDVPGHGRHADPHRPAAAVRASDLWQDFVKGDADVLAPMPPEVLRDKPLSISAVARAARMTLSHPRDAVDMRAVPTDLTVIFPVLDQRDAASDQRNLVLLPSSTALVDSYGSLPAIRVALDSDDKAGTRTYTVTDCGSRATVRFVFDAGVACPAIDVLDTLNSAAGIKQSFLATAMDELMHNANDLLSPAEQPVRPPARRAAMARLWSDLSDEVRRRVLGGFAGRQGLVAAELDVVRELKNGSEPARVSLASDMLMAALDLWQVRGEISRIPLSYWRSEMAQEMPADADGPDFMLARLRVQDGFMHWRGVHADLQHWLADPATGANAQLSDVARDCISAALTRADESGPAGPAWLPVLRGHAPRELRTGLSALHQAIMRRADATQAEIRQQVSHYVAQLCGTVDGELADDANAVAPATVAAVSALWPQLVAQTDRDVLRLDSHAERDQAIDLSLMNRRATLVLDHPGDLLQMSSIPAGLHVRFDAAGPGSVGSDQRWLNILPGQSDFLGRFGPLPVVYVTLSKGEHPGWQDYTIFDIDLRIGCNFTFTGAVAPRARSVLASLKQAADAKWSAFRELYGELSNSAQIGGWDGERRTMAAACWNAFPDIVRQRVLDYYRLNAAHRSLLEQVDIGEVLARGKNAAGLALARQALMSAMDYWDEHGEIDDAVDSFWRDAVEQGTSQHLSPANFAEILATVLQAHRQWQETAPLFDTMLQWLAQPVLQADDAYRQLRACLLRATQRAIGLPVAAAGVPDSLAQATSAQVRARLARVRQAVEMADAPSMTPFRILLRLRAWMTRIGGAEPIQLDAAADTINESTVENDCAPAGMGTRAVCYLLGADLPAAGIASLFAIESSLRADGTLPMDMLGKSYDGTEDGQRWWRSYRFYGAWRYQQQQRSWQRATHDMTVEGTLAAQREAFDAHMNALMEDMASSQSLYFFSNDRQQVELSGSVSAILAPRSNFAQRTVHLVGAGGLLMLPADLRGTVTIDVSRLDANAVSPINIAPLLMEKLQSHDPIQLDGKTFLRYRHIEDDTLTLQIGPQESSHPLRLTLASQLRDAVRQQLTDDLADDSKNVVLVGAELDEEILLPPMSRDVLIYPLGNAHKFIVRKMGPARVRLLSGPPLGEVSAALRIRVELAPEVLPRYGVSDLALGASGYLTAAIHDNQEGGTFLLCCAPGVTLERAAWNQSVTVINAVHNRYIDDLFALDEHLRGGREPDTSIRQTAQRYSGTLSARTDESMAQRAAMLSDAVEQRQQRELAAAQPGRAPGLGSQARHTVSITLARMLMFSFSRAFDGVSLEQWSNLVQARDSPSMVGCMIDMCVDMAWQHDESDEFYAGLAGLYGFLRMSTTDTTSEAGLERDQTYIDTVLDLIAGTPVSDDVLQQVGLADIRERPEHLAMLKTILITRRDDRLFDDDAFWRDRLLYDLRRGRTRSRRSSVLNLLSSIISGEGGRDAVMMAYQHKKLSPKASHPALPEVEKKPDVVVFDQVSTMQVERNAPAATRHRLGGSADLVDDGHVCRLVSAMGFAGSLLVFIGDVGTAASKWYIQDHRSKRQRFTTMYFQVVKAFGWAGQAATGFACQTDAGGPARFVRMTAPVVGLGMSFNYLAGGLAELVVRSPRTRWTWRSDMRPLVARLPGARASKIMQLTDLAGNIYLLVAEASKIVGLSAQAERTQGSDVIGVTVSCASMALGTITAAGEVGSKTLLSPARQFYQAVGMSSSLLNMCAATVGTLSSGTLRANPERHDL